MECQKHGCREAGVSYCKYCNKIFCSEHISAFKPFSPGLSSRNWRGSPNIEGHPCPAYSGSERSIGKTVFRETTLSEKSNNRKILIGAIIIIIVFIIGFVIYGIYSNNSNNNLSYLTTINVLGTQSNPYMPNTNNTLNWQGQGYYYIPISIPAAGLKQGVDLLSTKTQVDGYNQYVIDLYSNQTTINTNKNTMQNTSTSSTSSQLTTIVSQNFSQTTAQDAFQQINELRLSKGLGTLQWNSQFAQLAVTHSTYMLNSHNFSVGNIPSPALGAAIDDTPINADVEGCGYVITSEDIANCAVPGWTNSGTTLMDSQYTQIGIGVACNYSTCMITAYLD